MGKLRVFISHSAKSGVAARLLGDVVDALKTAGHAVLVDRELDAGDDWRATLNVWMGGCDAAVVLLSSDALTSRFLAYEISILSYRKTFDEAFELIPVIVRPTSSGAIDASPLGSAKITHWQSVVVAEEDAGDVAVARIVGALDGRVSRSTPIDMPAVLVRELLDKANIPEELLDVHFEDLGIEVPPWIPNDDNLGRLAVGMLAAGLAKNVDFIEAYRDRLQPPNEVVNLVDLLACSWVDYRSIREIPDAMNAERIIAVNARDPETARMYIIRTGLDRRHPLRPRNSWPFGAVDAKVPARDTTPEPGADATFDEVRAQVLRQLEQVLAVDNEAEVLEDLELRHKVARPVFVAMPAERVPASVAVALRDAFEGVSFFLLMGGHDGAGKDLQDIAVVLEPKLEQHAEDQFLATYLNQRKFLTMGIGE